MDEKRWEELKRKEKILKEAAEALRVNEKELVNVLKRFLAETEVRKKVIEKLKKLAVEG